MGEFLRIESERNTRLKAAARLRERRGRRQTGRTILDGQREIKLALQSGWQLVELFCSESALSKSAAVQAIAESAQRQNATVLAVVDNAFRKIAFGDRDEGVVATVEQPSTSLTELQLPVKPLVCVLDQVEKPGNIGAILRTADAAGVDAVVLSDPTTDVFNPNAIRASLGAVFHVPLGVASASEVVSWLCDNEVAILAARVDGAKPYDDSIYDGGVAIILGSEAHGLGDVWASPDVSAVAIPMRGSVDSLNVSASAAVLLFEAARQRRASSD